MAFEEFLNRCNLGSCTVQAMPFDCSLRRYYRVISGNERYILMDASQEIHTINPFLDIGAMILDVGLTAPTIYYKDLDSGYLLIEDFGDELFSDHIRRNPHRAESLYHAATDALILIAQSDTAKDLPLYSHALLDKELNVFVEFFLKQHLNEQDFDTAAKELFSIFSGLYKYFDQSKPVLVLRDYHADNLMLLSSKRSLLENLGMLDFQDAVLGHPAYDLVSLLQDARIDVSDDVEAMCIDRFLKYTGYERNLFDVCYNILNLQRNLKIVGVFHRKNILDHAPKYLAYLPRVWGYIEKGLNHPVNSDLKAWFVKYDILKRAHG